MTDCDCAKDKLLRRVRAALTNIVSRCIITNQYNDDTREELKMLLVELDHYLKKGKENEKTI